MKRYLILLFILWFSSVNAQVLNSKFDTKNHPKAKGVWATIKFPAGWKKQEGERPNIVQKFSGNYGDMYVVLSLQILDAGGPVEKECSDMSTAEFAEIFSNKPNSVFVVNVNKTAHEGRPAFIYDMKTTVERIGLKMNLAHRVMTVCYRNTLISAWCSPSKFDNQSTAALSTDTELRAANPICLQYFNSFVLMGQY